MHRRFALISLGTLIVGCASTDFKPLVFPPDTPLQDPLPGKAIAYLMRIPRDDATVEVHLNATLLAALPPATYTVLSFDPGQHNLETKVRAVTQDAVQQLLNVKAGERRFFYTSVPTRSSVTFSIVPIAAGFIPLFTPSTIAIGARRWTECREIDAQGLLSNAKLVMPERAA